MSHATTTPRITQRCGIATRDATHGVAMHTFVHHVRHGLANVRLHNLDNLALDWSRLARALMATDPIVRHCL